jgi:hypothetical protein
MTNQPDILSALIDDLTQLVQSSDSELSFLASVTLSRLVGFRSMSAQAGFVHIVPEQLNLVRDRPELILLFNQILNSLKDILRAFDSAGLSFREKETEKLVNNIRQHYQELQRLRPQG